MCDDGYECEILTLGTTLRCPCGGHVSYHRSDQLRRKPGDSVPWRCDACGKLLEPQDKIDVVLEGLADEMKGAK